MQRSTRIRLIEACYSVLVPIARLLLRSGISYKEFAEISRSAFVSVAGRDFGIRGRPTNASRVSAMTGIGRKEVRRLRQVAERYQDPRSEIAPLADVLHRWYTQPAYLNRNGRPRRLRFKGERRSFTTLVREAAGDLPAGAIRVELIRTGAVVVDARGYLLPTRRENVPDLLSDALINGVAFGLRALASTLAFNSGAPKELGRIERFAHSEQLGGVDLKSIRSDLRKRAADFVEEIDDFLTEVERSADGPSKMIGVGVYYYEDD